MFAVRGPLGESRQPATVAVAAAVAAAAGVAGPSWWRGRARVVSAIRDPRTPGVVSREGRSYHVGTSDPCRRPDKPYGQCCFRPAKRRRWADSAAVQLLAIRLTHRRITFSDVDVDTGSGKCRTAIRNSSHEYSLQAFHSPTEFISTIGRRHVWTKRLISGEFTAVSILIL